MEEELSNGTLVFLHPAPVIPPREMKRYIRKLKNRISARTSRQRQQDYIRHLEEENARLRQEITLVREELNKLNK